MHVVERFAEFALAFRAQPVPAGVLHHAKRAVIDWHAALLPGAVAAPATLLEKALSQDLDRGGATLALGRKATARTAALINASAAHTMEVDDIYRDAIYHPGAPTIAAGLQQAFRMDSMSKPLHAGHAAEAGLLAALAAREGATGSLDVIEGEAGFGHAMSNGPDWNQATATLGADFHITRMTFKNHACCGHTFAAIDGALELQRTLGVRAADIARVGVGTYRPALEVAGYEHPATPAEARFSLKYVVATALTHGSVRLAAFEPERLADTATRALMTRIEVSADAELDAAFPRQRAARVAIETRDGRRGEFLQPTRKGDPDMPLSDDELEEKFLELAASVLGEAAARALVARLWTLERAPAV